MRVHHYVKNVLIFLPLIFSGRIFEAELFARTLCGVFAFGLISSTIYIINDIRDVEQDRKHPTKRKRPIAAGTIPESTAWKLAVFLIAMALVLNGIACGANLAAWGLLAVYFALNLGYCFGLKNIPIIDIVILVSGFAFRVFYGSALTQIEISKWLYLTVICMSFYLGLGKRRNELLRSEHGHSRKVLRFYNHEFLDKNMYMCMALTIAFYSLWSVDPITIQRITNPHLIWTVPLVITICMKYSLNVEKSSDGDPVEVFFKDKVLIFLSLIYAGIMLIMVYF